MYQLQGHFSVESNTAGNLFKLREMSMMSFYLTVQLIFCIWQSLSPCNIEINGLEAY